MNFMVISSQGLRIEKLIAFRFSRLEICPTKNREIELKCFDKFQIESDHKNQLNSIKYKTISAHAIKRTLRNLISIINITDFFSTKLKNYIRHVSRFDAHKKSEKKRMKRSSDINTILMYFEGRNKNIYLNYFTSNKIKKIVNKM
jgi:hypothetical protein